MSIKESDIIKVLKMCCCESNIKSCSECPYDEIGCVEKLLSDVLELIETKNAELERKSHILECYALQYGTVVDKSKWEEKSNG